MVETINKLKFLTDVVSNDLVRQQFINVYNAVWKQGGEQVYEREANYFNKILRENANLNGCTSLSVFFAFIDLAVQGISVEPGVRAMAYLLPRNYKIGTDQQGKSVYEKRCNLTISGYGELYLRARAGQIYHADNPVVVYEGDDFEYGERDGRKYVNYSMHIPRTSSHIIACFLKITRTDGTIDYSVMLEQDWTRLAGYSAKNNKYWDNNTRRKPTNSTPLAMAASTLPFSVQSVSSMPLELIPSSTSARVHSLKPRWTIRLHLTSIHTEASTAHQATTSSRRHRTIPSPHLLIHRMA